MADFIKSEAADVPARYGYLRKRNPQLNSISWIGGKSCVAGDRIGEWILRLLPKPANPVYFEPFGGSAAILINKPIVSREVYNDANGRLVNFWRHIKNPDFEEKLKDTPTAELVFDEALMLLDSEDKFEAAWAFAVVLWLRAAYPTPIEESMFELSFYHSLKTVDVKTHRRKHLWEQLDMPALRERLRHVVMCNRDACDLLEKSARYDYVDIYCDPPYLNSADGGYNHDVDYDRMSELLLSQKGRVAVSGVDGDWNHLDWRCETFEKSALLKNRYGGKDKRKECLWMNYPAEFSVWDGQMSLGDV